MQRGLGTLRIRLLVTFEDQWGEELVSGQFPVPELRAEVMAVVSLGLRGLCCWHAPLRPGGLPPAEEHGPSDSLVFLASKHAKRLFGE